MQISGKLSFLTQWRFIFWFFIVLFSVASVHRYLLDVMDPNHSVLNNHINNYLIFRSSFWNLVEYKDLYILHPQLHNDLFKYSPTFALLMAPFSLAPVLPGLVLWNLINAFTLYWGIKMLPLDEKKKAYMVWFVVLELLTSIQNAQTNGMVAGLIILAFVMFERQNLLLASLFIVLTFYIKVFGVVAGILFLFYPGKIRFILYCLLWLVIFTLLPLVVVSPAQLVFLYKSWWQLLQNDHAGSTGISLMGIVYSWFGIDARKIIQVIGMVLFFLPFIHFRKSLSTHYLLLVLSSILLWMIVFNHRSESPTFVIAVAGVALWYFSSETTPLDLALVILTFVLTCLSPTDLFPRYLRETYIVPYSLKVLPCVLVWFRIQYQILTYKSE